MSIVVIIYFIIIKFCCLSVVGLTDFFTKLDERYNSKVKKDGTAMARKIRRLGAPAATNPPNGAPTWVIDSQWKSKNNSYYYSYNIIFLL